MKKVFIFLIFILLLVSCNYKYDSSDYTSFDNVSIATDSGNIYNVENLVDNDNSSYCSINIHSGSFASIFLSSTKNTFSVNLQSDNPISLCIRGEYRPSYPSSINPVKYYPLYENTTDVINTSFSCSESITNYFVYVSCDKITTIKVFKIE